MRNFNGFTLAEVLITLGIIGVVAAITIPGLMTNYKAHRFRSQFLKSYSTLQQVIREMLADDVSLDNSDYPAHTFYKTFITYLSGAMDCGTGYTNGAPCLQTREASLEGYKTYKNYNRKSNASMVYFDDGQIAMQDGTLLLFENTDGSGGQIFITVDLNGFNNPPNQWGYDLFTFQLIDNELRPMGNSKTKYKSDNYCNLSNNSGYNGIACTQVAIDDPDYFKKMARKFK